MTEQEVTMFENYLLKEYNGRIEDDTPYTYAVREGWLIDQLEKAFMAGRKSVESD